MVFSKYKNCGFVLTLCGLTVYGYADTDIYGYADTDTRIRICRYGYADTDTRIRIRGYGYADTDMRIRICEYGHADADIRIRIREYGGAFEVLFEEELDIVIVRTLIVCELLACKVGMRTLIYIYVSKNIYIHIVPGGRCPPDPPLDGVTATQTPLPLGAGRPPGAAERPPGPTWV